MIYQHPLAYLIAMEGRALLQAWSGADGYDQEFVEARLREVRRLLADDELVTHPGVQVDRDATAAVYRRWSVTYDEPGNGLFEIDTPIIAEIAAALPPGMAVDAGCGTGRIAALLAGQGHRVLGVDSSLEMMRRARPIPLVTFVAGDLCALPVATGSTDLVVSALALTHVDNLGPVFAEFARVLRPGGHVVVSDVHHELVLLGSVAKGLSDTGRPQMATAHGHRAGDFLRASLPLGFEVRRYEEEPRQGAGSSGPLPEPSSEIGEWPDWPWTLHGLIPEATHAAWNTPAVVVWQFQLSKA